MNMKITSRAFVNNGLIPPLFTCNGDNVNPPLLIEDIPNGTKALAIIMEDPDAKVGTWDHWVKFNIPVESDAFYIEEGEEPEGTSGKGSSGDLTYFGPCPPEGTHRYVFRVYAVDGALDLEEGATKEEVLEAMQGHVLEETQLIGLYTQNVHQG